MNKEYYISTLNPNTPTEQLMNSGSSIPKVIAETTICGAVTIPVYDYMDWNPPTPEQVKNLKEMLNIDVKLIGEDND